MDLEDDIRHKEDCEGDVGLLTSEAQLLRHTHNERVWDVDPIQ